MHMKIKLGFFVCGTAAAVLMCADVALGGVREQCAGVWKGGASGLAKETYLVLRADGTGAAFGVSERGEQHKAYEFEFEPAGDALKLKNRWAMRKGKRRDYSIGPFRMSDFSRRILYTQDFEDYNRRRQENARYLWENLKDNSLIEIAYSDISDISTGPLFFPFYLKCDREVFRKKVFIPAHMRSVHMWCEQLEKLPEELQTPMAPLYNEMVQLPIGLDYGKEEMDRIIACFQP